MRPPDFIFQPSRIFLPDRILVSESVAWMFARGRDKVAKKIRRNLRALRRLEARERDRHDNFTRGPRQLPRLAR